jgi:aminoglycoside phosphotransferase (APT) family kinase protein
MIRPDFDAETQVRSALETCGSKIPFPRILASGLLHDSIDWAYIIEPFCPGQATREVWQGMDLASRENVASQVGWILRDLHSTPLSLLPALNVTAAEWRERARLKLQTCVDEVAAAEMAPGACLPGPLVENLRRFMEASGGPAISSVQDGSLRLLHGDITEDHVLVEPVGGGRWRVSGLIDYGDARVGPLFDEWVVLWLCLFRQDPAALRAFFKTYGEPGGPHPFTPAFGETMLTFTLLHCFNGAIVREVVRRAGVDPSTLTNLCALTQIMWPPA